MSETAREVVSKLWIEHYLSAARPPNGDSTALFAAALTRHLAVVCEAHKGYAARQRKALGRTLGGMSQQTVAEIIAEERGEDIASEHLAKALRAFAGEPTDDLGILGIDELDRRNLGTGEVD